MQKKLPAWLVLTVICLVAAVLLAVTNMVTAPTIKANADREAMATRLALLPGSVTFEDMDNGVSAGKDGDGENANTIGYAATGVAQGFGGEVETTVVLKPDGTISGVSVGGANFAETAGLGARAKEPEFQAQFAGKQVPVELSKNGGEIDALSGATITSKAVIKGANEAIARIVDTAKLDIEIAAPAGPEVYSDGNGAYWFTAEGFGGPVFILVEEDETGAITAVVIGDDQFAETPGLGARTQEAAFTGQFTGKTLPLQAGDVDIITGATVTSTAVLDGVGTIAEAIGTNTVVIAERPATAVADEPDTEPAAETAAEPTAEPTALPLTEPTADTTEGPAAETNAATEAKSYTAEAQGCVSRISVTLTLDADGKIATFAVNAEGETPGLGLKAQDAEYTDQFIGKTLPLKDGDVDTISGATVTSEAVLSAVAEIAEKLAAPAEEPAKEPDDKPAEETGAATETASYTAEAQGCVSKISVTLTLDADGKIVAFAVNAEGETPGLGLKAQDAGYTDQFIGKTLPLKDGDVDAISGATVTSNAVLAAVAQIAEGLH